MILTDKNYRTGKADMIYMSYSQLTSFMSCEARAIAELSGVYERPPNNAFLQGHYFEALLNGKKDEFIDKNRNDMTYKNNEFKLLADFIKVECAFSRIKEERFLMDIIENSEQQQIYTGEIEGIPFKAKLDYLDPVSLSIYDTKVMGSFRRDYNTIRGQYEEWYQLYNYHYQIAVYRELVKQHYGKVGSNGLIAVTKDYEPEIQAIMFSDDDLDNTLDIIKDIAPAFQEMKEGKREPERCETCPYCKETRVIDKFRKANIY